MAERHPSLKSNQRANDVVSSTLKGRSRHSGGILNSLRRYSILRAVKQSSSTFLEE
jgi:hypothetical protein